MVNVNVSQLTPSTQRSSSITPPGLTNAPFQVPSHGLTGPLVAMELELGVGVGVGVAVGVGVGVGLADPHAPLSLTVYDSLKLRSLGI